MGAIQKQGENAEAEKKEWCAGAQRGMRGQGRPRLHTGAIPAHKTEPSKQARCCHCKGPGARREGAAPQQDATHHYYSMPH